MYPLILAWRYSRGRLVNYVAILAVALALTVQIVVMAVLDGMLQDMRQRIRDLGEQITVTFYDASLPTLADMKRTNLALKQKVPGVRGLTPLIQSYGAIEKNRYFTPVIAYGIDLAREAKLSQLPKHLLDLKLDPRKASWTKDKPAPNSLPRMFIGAQVAERLQVMAGDQVSLSYVKTNSDKVARQKFIIASTFRSGSIINDRWVVYIPHAIARKMFLTSPTRHPQAFTETFCVWLKDPDQADKLEQKVYQVVLQTLGPRRFRTRTWQRQWRTISEGMAYENRLQELILLLMNLSGGFCVFAIIATMVSKRMRDIGLLRCIGATRLGVVGTFLLVGLIIGLAGSLLGLGAGYVLAEPGLFFAGGRPLVDYLHQEFTGQPLYPPRMFLVGGVKPIFGAKVLLYACGATLISILAAAYPAIWAGTREPVEALQNG